MDDENIVEDKEADEFEALIEQIRELRLHRVPGVIRIINFNQIIVGGPGEEVDSEEDNSVEEDNRSDGTYTWVSDDDSEGWSSDSDTTQPLYLLSLLFF